VSGGLRFDHTVGSFANLDPATGIQALGRIGADTDWTSLRWNLNGAIYLEQLFDRTDKVRALSHELSLRLKGRFLLRGERLIAQEQEPLGGALSVRGYPESVLSADEFTAATLEYSYHIPRKLKPAEPGTLFRQPFKWRPTQVGQNPDWDLILRAFSDYANRSVTPAKLQPGQTANTGELPLVDRNLSMAGVGVGVALTIKQNFSLRCDFGTALIELKDKALEPGKQIRTAKGNKEIYVVSSFSW
jgi:hemolysin activation/secretion protein